MARAANSDTLIDEEIKRSKGIEACDVRSLLNPLLDAQLVVPNSSPKLEKLDKFLTSIEQEETPDRDNSNEQKSQ